MRSAIRKKVKEALAGRAEVAEQAAPARLLRIKGNLPESIRRSIAMMRVTEGMRRNQRAGVPEGH